MDEGARPASGVRAGLAACGAAGEGVSGLECGGEFEGGAVDGVLGSWSFVLQAVEGVPGVAAHGFICVGAGCGLEWDAGEVGVQRGFPFGDLGVGFDAAYESGEDTASGVDLGEAVGVPSEDVE